VITPEDRYEQQPVASADGRLVLVSDGRLDNRPELADRLRISTHEAATLPDSTLILRAYERWGEDAPQHLIGDYAFALWDGRQQTLLLARSPLGNRPLYYYHTPRVFAFATMPNGLFALPWVPRRLVLENLLEPAPACTPFQGLHKLPDGHWLRVNERGLQEQLFWQLDLTRRISFKRDEEYVEAFHELLTTAVASRLRSLYPVGISLSGGLDSSTVAATAAPQLAQQNQPLYAYTQVPTPAFAGPLPPGKYADETPFVQAIAAMYPNLRLHFINTTDQPIFADINRFFDAMIGPFQNVANRPWIEAIQAQAQADGVRVLLTGEAGNLTVSWKGTSALPELVRKGALHRAWCMARGETRSSVSAGRRLLSEGMLPLLPSRIQALTQTLRQGSINALYPRSQSLPVPFQSRWLQARHRQWWLQANFRQPLPNATCVMPHCYML
jgi:asparagine synthase (glutamine-hydrolysing)